MEVALLRLFALISKHLRIFQWARIEDRVWLHIPPFRTRPTLKIIVNAAVATFRGQQFA